jgi:hypothetical protein
MDVVYKTKIRDSKKKILFPKSLSVPNSSENTLVAILFLFKYKERYSQTRLKRTARDRP